jgi:hypothetical protein
MKTIEQPNSGREITMKKPSWLPWRRRAKKSGAAKVDDLQNVRRQTDQKLKREKAEKEQQEARERPSSRRGDEQT